MTTHLIKRLIVLATLCFSTWVGAASYTYDNLDRLTSVVFDGGAVQNFSYDPAGNMLALSTSGLMAQTILFGAAPTLAVGGTGAISATATSGLPVSLSSSTPAVCTIVGNAVTGVTVGICTIAANQSGNGSYQAALQVTQNFNITASTLTAQTITFTPLAPLSVGSSVPLAATATSGLLVSFTSSTPTICAVSGTTVTGLAAGICKLIANQAGNGTFQSAQTTQTVAVSGSATATGMTKISAGQFHSCTVTATGGVKCWGLNTQGQLGDNTLIDRLTPVDVVGLTSGVVAISSGNNHTCALTSVGGVKCWGENFYGGLGDNSTVNRSTPVDVIGLTSGVVAISAGGTHTCALTVAGGVKCWGDNIYGELGDNTTLNRSTPVDVSGLTSGVAAISAGFWHSCALTTTGGMKCWGDNWYGQMGNGNNVGPQQVPVDVPSLLSGVSGIAAGAIHTCALTTTGGVKCWGANVSGQLGDGTTLDHWTPMDVTGLTTGVSTVVAGGYDACALTTAGGLKCWGFNGDGRLGDNSAVSRSTPVDVFGLTSGVSAVAMGYGHSCAITQAGAVKCWGGNAKGQLGDGTIIQRLAPVNVLLGTTITAQTITFGAAPSVAVGGTGTLSATATSGLPVSFSTTTSTICSVSGSTVTGLAVGTCTVAANQAGDATYQPATQVVQAIAINASIQTISFGTAPSITVGNAGVVSAAASSGLPVIFTTTTPTICAVSGSTVTGLAVGTCTIAANQAGDAIYQPAAQVVQAITINVSIVPPATSKIALGDTHSCVVNTTGGVKCWGTNYWGQLGDNSLVDRNIPVDVVGLASGVVSISAGGGFNCATTSVGGVKCWGRNNSGQIGDNSLVNRLAPVDVLGLTGGVSAVATGGYHACALTTAGGVKCWGYNGYGQLGDNTVVDHATPLNVVGLSSGIVSIVAGQHHTCALTTAGGVKCWGYNLFGALGNNTTVNSQVPVDVQGLLTGVVSIVAGGYHTCAIMTTGAMKCWGDNSSGQLGNNTVVTSVVPVDVTGLASNVTAGAASSYHTCAIVSAGGTKCWGTNAYGELGDGTITQRLIPTDVSTLTSGVSAVSAGLWHTCALTSLGGVKCWGWNLSGQVGDGSTMDRWLPVDILLGTNIATPQSITFDVVPALTVGGVGGLKVTATSGLPAVLSSLTPTICSVVGSTVTGISVGMCTLAANQAGNSTYQAAPQTTTSIPVTLAPRVSLSVNTLAFAARNIGNPSTPQVVTLTNTGSVSLSITGVLATGDFAQTNTCASVLSAGASCAISVTFTASAVGARTGSVTVSSTAVPSSNIIALTGTGKATYADFNGDGKSDMLWRNPSSGIDAIWIMNGTTLVSNTAITTVPAPWAVAGMGDFNGDGKSDIVWRNPVSGADALWLMNGTTLLSNTAISIVPVSVMIAGVGDFNGDGKSDILWRNPTTGTDAMWLMNGSTLLSNIAITTVPTPWFIAGTGDFNGDGKSDILWRNPTSGVNAIWIMNGATLVSNTAITIVPAPWVIAGTGDFNGDGKSDILWRNPVSGLNAIWLMNGATIASNTAISTVPASVMVAGVGDYNGDGKSDIVWRNPTTGTDAIWLMNGVTLLKNGAVGTVPLPWALVK
ncbi:MAG: FG-GAP-like repeat-containing protein [Gallionella sp.]|nr:FG-GAP-like repeat-containing protein [Gallionella sp.]